MFISSSVYKLYNVILIFKICIAKLLATTSESSYVLKNCDDFYHLYLHRMYDFVILFVLSKF